MRGNGNLGEWNYAQAMTRRQVGPCQFVQASYLNQIDEELCARYLSLPLAVPPNCSANRTQQPSVPRIYHAVGKSVARPANVDMNAAAHLRGFELRYHDDESGAEYVAKRCGAEAGRAYRCLLDPAYRADLFRWCALYAEGGVYIDTDILLQQPIESIVNMCTGATIGYDLPAANRHAERKQMKVLASVPTHPLARCMLETIVNNVRRGILPPRQRPLLLTGPELLQECYTRTYSVDDIAITYRDSVRAAYPYTGLVGASGLIAFEQPNSMDYPQSPKKVEGGTRWTRKTIVQPFSRQKDAQRYGALTLARQIYTDGCNLAG